MFVALILGSAAYVLFIDVITQVEVSLVTAENQFQPVMMVFDSLPEIPTKCDSFCFIVFSLHLQDLSFARKDIKSSWIALTL